MGSVVGDVGVAIGLNERDLQVGVGRVNQALTELASTVEKLGARIDAAMGQATGATQKTTKATKELTEEERQAAEAAKRAAEEQKRLAEQQKAAEKAAREHKRALDDMRQGLQQISAAAAVVSVTMGLVAKSSSDAFKQQQSAFFGLDAVATKTIGSSQAATEAAQALAKDGLMTIVEASKAVQAGLASGFGLEETINLIKAFRDSAAFNRQAGLEFGESVVRAMEGVRMGNSILSDAAGITKNLSQILKEAGYSEQDLMKVSSDAAIRRALYNGILKEGALFAGNAAKAADTLAGAEARATTAAFNAKAAFGEALAPATTALSDAVTGLLGKLGAFIEANPELARTAFLVVGGIAATTAAVGGLAVAFLALNTALGPVGWALMGIGAAVGALTGMALATESIRREQSQLRSETAGLMRQYEALRGVLDDSTSSTEEKEQASKRLKDVLAALFKLQPQMKSWFDEEGRLLDTATGKWDRYRNAVVNATRIEATQRVADANKELNDLREQRAGKEQDIRSKDQPVIDSFVEQARLRYGQAEADKRRAILEGEMDDAIALAVADLDRKIALAEAKLAKDEALIEALNAPLSKEDVLPPPPPGGGPPPPGSGKMSAGLAAALEDLQDIQALDRTPEALEKQLAKVREILSTHGEELEKLGKSRDLSRLRDIVLPREILEAADQATGQQFRSALEQLSADTQLQNLSPETIRERLEGIRDQFSAYLEAHPDQGLQMELRLKGATDAELRAPLERWQALFRENEQLGLYNGPGMAQYKLGALREGQALALAAGDQDTWYQLTGQIKELEAALQQADFEGKLKRIGAAREQAFRGASAQMAELEKALIDAEASDDTQMAANIRQRMLDLVRPALEAQKKALEELLASITGTDEQAAQQRAQVEAELVQVKEQLYDQDVAAHRIATEAKTAAERAAAQERKSLEAQMRTWIQSMADSDLASIRAAQRAEEERAAARIRHLQEELRALEEKWAAEDRRNRMEDLKAELAAVMADTSFQKVDPVTGELVWTYDEARARELQEQIKQAEVEEAREKERQKLQDQIEAAQKRLDQMRSDHAEELEERQLFWQKLLSGDLSAFDDLTEAAKQGLGPWVETFATKLGELLTTWQTNATGIEDAAKRINDAWSSLNGNGSTGGTGAGNTTQSFSPPTLPGSLSGSIGAATSGSATAQVSITINGATDPQATAAAVRIAAQQGTEAGLLDALVRSGRAGLRTI